ncbi:MAG: bifunctional homocysteine S-methyltransferase/methylenetetrahydrofolate reductase [Myxococcales bacterium 68-20]|nr:bifunctional homocysteine S-methyltransferase/methylenetetrahydrofolate reductase [Myxococcales bacterium]OJY29849.1 MAG: bifunctional homocysteine S-methyltransferase/methylenetetrahydrofolate reductase [Myxococcales bacterium 68-20]
MARLLEALEGGPLVVDGAMGSQLFERGILHNACLEELCVSKPEVIRKVHEDYVRAGAQVLETNTFGANAMRLEKYGLATKVKELNEAAVKVARDAAGAKAFVVGALGPSGYFLGEALPDDLSKVRAALHEQASVLVDSGVDGILVETFRQTNELRIAIESAVAAAGGKIPVIASASVDERSRMADGTSSAEIARLMREWGASVVGVNCCDGPMNVLEAITPMLELGIPVWAVPNAGLPRRVDERLVYVSTSEYFGVYARRMFKLGVKLVGGCCGTTPDHVRRIAAAARMAGAAERGATAQGESDAVIRAGESFEAWSADPPESPSSAKCVPFADRSDLAAKIARGQFVVSVEVNPPVGLDLAKAIGAAKMLKAGGVDVINIADGARAQARMGNVAMAMRVQEQCGMETILHVCGRDRNLLGTLAHLLAAHELGVKNLVIVTGDPPKMGDFPDASAVYDLDSIGILKLAARLNYGIDPGGKALGGATRFVLATGAEPAALNYERELARLKQKKLAGAQIVMTQPVYDPAVLEKFLEDIAPLGLPVLVGLLPLASYRNAEFLHNEVPGMQVPEAVRERMRKAGSGAQARKEGVAIAREMLAAVRSRVAGAYIMPPLERYELALEVVDGFLESEPALTTAKA